MTQFVKEGHQEGVCGGGEGVPSHSQFCVLYPLQGILRQAMKER